MQNYIELRIRDKIEEIQIIKRSVDVALERYENKESSNDILLFFLKVKCDNVKEILTEIQVYANALKGVY